MMSGATTITLQGRLTNQPDLRFTPSGAAKCQFRLASTERVFDRQTGEWKDGNSLFVTCNAWRDVAEAIADTCSKGSTVIVVGRLHQRSYEDKDGNKRSVCEVEVDDCGLSLRWAKTDRPSQPADDPWVNASDEPGF